MKKLAGAVAAFALMSSTAFAAQCGNDGAGFAAWKQAFAAEAQAAGVGQAGLQALANAQYSQSTINADRNQRGVKYALNDFIRIRLGSLDNFAAQAKRVKAQSPAFYASLEQVYGVPSGILPCFLLIAGALRQINGVRHMVKWATRNSCRATP